MRAVALLSPRLIGGLCGVQKWGVPISSGADSLLCWRGMVLGTKGEGFYLVFYCDLIDDLDNQINSLQIENLNSLYEVFVVWILTPLLTPLVGL